MRQTNTSVRPAAAAGMFYPGDAEALRPAVAGMLARPGMQHSRRTARAPNAAILPHAGSIYSGEIAAAAYKRLLADAAQISRIVLMGPAHRVFVRGLAAPSVGAFATPLGAIPVDQAAIASLADLPQVVVSDEAH